MGKIVTFYSYKGGTGRSMALANVAWTLASNEQRVLVVDWDLEAPGLHRYFRPFLLDKELVAPETEGLIDFVRNYALKASTLPLAGQRPKNWYEPFAEIGNWGTPLRWPDGSPVRLGQRGEIHFVPAGRQGTEYASVINSFDWSSFYERLSGGAFLDAVREKMRAFDFALIDSRTGVSDTSGICTIHMPDTVVVCYTYNIQSIEGAFAIAKIIKKQRPDMPIFPVAMRVEFQEERLLKRMRGFARARFGEFVDVKERDAYLNSMEVPYYTKYAYSERLAAFEEEVEAKGSINPEINQLATYLAGRRVSVTRPPTPQREQVVSEFERSPLENIRSEPVGSAKIRWRSALWAAVAALLAVGIALSLIRAPSPSYERTNLILASVTDASIEVQIGALLEDARLTETPEVRSFVRKLFENGVPTAVLHAGPLVENTTYHLDEAGQRVIGCINSGSEIDTWRIENGRSIARLVPFLGRVRLPVIIDCLLLPRVDEALVVTDTGFDLFDLATPDATEGKWQKNYLSDAPGKRLLAGLPIGVATISRDGNSISVAGNLKDSNNFIDVWKLEGNMPPEQVTSFSVPGGRVSNSVSALKDTYSGILFLSVDEKNNLQIWQLGKSPRVQTMALSFPGTYSIGSRLLALTRGTNIRLFELGTWRFSSTNLSAAPLSTTLPVFSSNDQYFAYATESGFEVRKTTAMDKVDWSVTVPPTIPLGFRSLNISTDGRIVQYGSLIYRNDRALPKPDAPWAELVRDLRAYTTICMPAADREKIFLESKEEAQSKWKSCETSQGRETPLQRTRPSLP